jgi:glycyl-tRNA synthetase beta chain
MTTETLLFEIGSEELPPKSLMKLANALSNNLQKGLKDAKFDFGDVEVFASPRRLAVAIHGLMGQQPDRQVEKLGPPVAAAYDADGNPKPAAVGFAKSAGVSIDAIQHIETPKGLRIGVQFEEKGQALANVLPDILKAACKQLPIPKPMRWGQRTVEFIRPVHWLMCLFGNEVIPVELFDQTASNQTFGHRFHHPEAIEIKHPNDYQQALLNAKVVADFAERKAMISEQAHTVAATKNAKVVIDPDLHDEVTALVEWPVALIGEFDASFLKVPAEALISSMAEHQKYFHLLGEQQQLMPLFITIANIESSRPQSIVEGNEKVIRPRLADAKFFYETDCKQPLSQFIPRLETILFQKKLGTVADKITRISKTAAWIADAIDYDSSLAQRAATLCKCDLMSEMVYEFPDLQGIMGRYYAEKDGEHADVCAAMDEVYMPRFAGDQLPQTGAGRSIALADRIDTLVGIFGIGQAPTGAKDPFALRRAALGVLRIIIESDLTQIDLSALIDASMDSFEGIALEADTKPKLLEFFNARLQAWYQEKGISLPVLHSVLALNLTNPSDVASRLNAVNAFSQTEAAQTLSAANKRVGNILAKVEDDVSAYALSTDLLSEDAEIQLVEALQSRQQALQSSLQQRDYDAALNCLAELKDPVDLFFDTVMVMADDEAVRKNRIALLNQLRGSFIQIADISLLQQ